MPPRPHMEVTGNPGVTRSDFEPWSLAVSVINGCGAGIDARGKTLRAAGVDSEAIHTPVRLAAISHAVAIAIDTPEAVLPQARG
ncbi:alkyl hydroperoxide reductase subunit D [Bradyrhizobium sp. Gha]|nr:alkyl hydroperoxide reductase subunit D [Bradyrhizobium sp. Gha]